MGIPSKPRDLTADWLKYLLSTVEDNEISTIASLYGR